MNVNLMISIAEKCFTKVSKVVKLSFYISEYHFFESKTTATLVNITVNCAEHRTRIFTAAKELRVVCA